MLHLAVTYTTKKTHIMQFRTFGKSKNMYNTAGLLYVIDIYSQHTYISLNIHIIITFAYFTILTNVNF